MISHSIIIDTKIAEVQNVKQDQKIKSLPIVPGSSHNSG